MGEGRTLVFFVFIASTGFIYSTDEPKAKSDTQQSQPMTKSLESYWRRRAKQVWEDHDLKRKRNDRKQRN